MHMLCIPKANNRYGFQIQLIFVQTSKFQSMFVNGQFANFNLLLLLCKCACFFLLNFFFIYFYFFLGTILHYFFISFSCFLSLTNTIKGVSDWSYSASGSLTLYHTEKKEESKNQKKKKKKRKNKKHERNLKTFSVWVALALFDFWFRTFVHNET